MKDGFLLYKDQCTYLVTYTGEKVLFYSQRSDTRSEWMVQALDNAISLRAQNYLMVNNIKNTQIGVLNYFADRGYTVSNAFADIETVSEALGIRLV